MLLRRVRERFRRILAIIHILTQKRRRIVAMMGSRARHKPAHDIALAVTAASKINLYLLQIATR